MYRHALLFSERLLIVEQGKDDSGELSRERDFGGDFRESLIELFL